METDTYPLHDRPREKLLRLGAAGLGDNELVAIVVGSGTRRSNALDLANEILETANGLHGNPRAHADDLRAHQRHGAAKAAQVLAAVEVGRRTLLRCPPARLQFVTPREVGEYLLPQFGSRPVEQFGVMMLDTKHRLMRASIVSVGTSTRARRTLARSSERPHRPPRPRSSCSTIIRPETHAES